MISKDYTLFCFRGENTAFIRETIIEKKSADQNPATEKSGTIAEAPHINKAFITKENNPNVNMVIGKVKIVTTGFINKLITAKTTAKIIAPSKVVVTPGKR
jgi:hypothetical protein